MGVVGLSYGNAQQPEDHPRRRHIIYVCRFSGHLRLHLLPRPSAAVLLASVLSARSLSFSLASPKVSVCRNHLPSVLRPGTQFAQDINRFVDIITFPKHEQTDFDFPPWVPKLHLPLPIQNAVKDLLSYYLLAQIQNLHVTALHQQCYSDDMFATELAHEFLHLLN
jgi:hypothetical protein